MNRFNKVSLPVLAMLVFIGLTQSCKKEVIISTSPSFNYFPSDIGKWVIYDVDSVYHGMNDNNNDDSVYRFQFQIKEIIDSSFEDGEGRTNQIVYRYRRVNPVDSWMLVAVWTQYLTLSSAYRKEDNIYYHRLAFPISSSITWNGNDANTLTEELYEYTDFHIARTLGGLNFDSTLSVLQNDEDNYVEKKFATEIYANHVGLIYKEHDDLGKRNGIVVSGLEYKESINDFGPR